MAEVKRIPSGLWQAVVVLPVKLPSGRNKRVTKTHQLKRVVDDWATALEAAVSAGTWLDPRNADITLAEYRARWASTRIADSATVKKNESHWKNHVGPVWGGYPIGLISRPKLKAWVHTMATAQCARCRQTPAVRNAVLAKHKTPSGRECTGSGSAPGLGAWTIQGAVSHLSGLLGAAVEDGLIPANPAFKLDLPPARPKPVFFWTRSEAAAILMQLGDLDALAVDLDMHIGLRPGELFGLKQQFVDTDRWLVYVAGVATREGWRPWAKTSKSHRAVPVPMHLRSRLLERLLGLGPDDLVFPAPGGGVWDDRNYAERVFVPAVRAAGVKLGTPYDMRHTAASWLVQAGVDLQRVQELLGHEKYSTTLRYAHLRPGAFGEVLDAWGSAPLDPRSQTPSSPDPHGAFGHAKSPTPPGGGIGL